MGGGDCGRYGRPMSARDYRPRDVTTGRERPISLDLLPERLLSEHEENENLSKDKGKMSVAEAGRKGGLAVRDERGIEFYEEIGRKAATRDAAMREFVRRVLEIVAASGTSVAARAASFDVVAVAATTARKAGVK